MARIFEWDNIKKPNVIDDLNNNRGLAECLAESIDEYNNDVEYKSWADMPEVYNSNLLLKMIVFDIVKTAELMAYDYSETKGEKTLNCSLSDFVNKYKNRLCVLASEKEPRILNGDLLDSIAYEFRKYGFRVTFNKEDNTFGVHWRIG